MSSSSRSHIDLSAALPSRRSALAAFGLVLIVAWLAVDPGLWPVGLAGGLVFCIGLGQMAGWIRPV